MNWLLRAFFDRFHRERFEITRGWIKDPYLTRYTLLGARQGSDVAVYVHRFERSDADEMHDHPWAFSSLILAGGYHEVTPAAGWANGSGPTRRRWYGPGRVLHRPANWIHRVEIAPGQESWSLIVRTKKVRGWGFWCPNKGFVPWREHEKSALATGAGCGG